MHCTGCGKKLKVTNDKLNELDVAACTPCKLNFEILADPQDGSASIQVIPFGLEEGDGDDEDGPDP